MFILVEVSGIKDLLHNFVKVHPSSVITQLTADGENKRAMGHSIKTRKCMFMRQEEHTEETIQ